MQGQGIEGKEKGRTGSIPSSAARAHIAESIKRRAASDELIKGWYTYIPAVAVIFGLLTLAILIYIAGLETGILLGLFFMFCVGFAIMAVLNYKLVKRYNAHAKREAALRTGIIEFVRAAAEEQGMMEQVANEVSTMESVNRDALAHEREASLLATPFAAVPLAGFVAEYYALHAITGPAATHDRRWHALMQQAGSASTKLGFELMLPSSKVIPKRSFALYLVLSLALFPFLAYWYFVLIKDMNEHFEAQWTVEDSLMSTLK
jgi:hypothetical protein